MKKQTTSILLLLLVAFFQASCDAAQYEALKALEKMKAKDYFEDDLQIRFVEAVGKGDRELMRELLDQGADVDKVGREEMRPLFWALAKQSLSGFEFLLENGAEPNFYMEDTDGRPHQHRPSLMEFLAELEVPEYLKLALKHGGDPDFIVESRYPDGRLSSRRPIIFSAIMRNETENVRILSEAGADIDYRDTEFSRQSPMITAAGINNYDMVYLLLKKGADPTLEDKWGYDLAESIKQFEDRGMKKGSEQYRWYLKVIEELKNRGLWN